MRFSPPHPACSPLLGSGARHCLPPPCFVHFPSLQLVLRPLALGSWQKPSTLRVGLGRAGANDGARIDLARVILMLGRFMGLMLSPSRHVSVFRLIVPSTWSTCPASQPVMLLQLLRCKVSPLPGWTCTCVVGLEPNGAASPVHSLPQLLRPPFPFLSPSFSEIPCASLGSVC